MAITASESRQHLRRLIEQVNDDRTPAQITSRRGDAVLLSRADYDALKATAHLLRVQANARRLVEGLQQALAGQRVKSTTSFGSWSSRRTVMRTTSIGSPRTGPASSDSGGCVL